MCLLQYKWKKDQLFINSRSIKCDSPIGIHHRKSSKASSKSDPYKITTWVHFHLNSCHSEESWHDWSWLQAWIPTCHHQWKSTSGRKTHKNHIKPTAWNSWTHGAYCQPDSFCLPKERVPCWVSITWWTDTLLSLAKSTRLLVFSRGNNEPILENGVCSAKLFSKSQKQNNSTCTG